MSHILDEPFFDISNDFIIGSPGEHMTVFKNQYPDLLFLGPFLENDKEFLLHLHIRWFAEFWNLKYIELPTVYVFNYVYGNSSNVYLNKEISGISTPVYTLAYPNFYRKNRFSLAEKGIYSLEKSGVIQQIPLNETPEFLQSKLSSSTLSKLSKIQVNQFIFRQKCVSGEEISNIDTSVYDYFTNCVYEKLDTDLEKAKFVNDMRGVIDQELMDTFAALYLLGFTFDITALNNTTKKLDFTRYSDYLEDVSDSLLFALNDSSDEIVDVNTIYNSLITSSYSNLLDRVLTYKISTGIPILDEILYYRMGAFVGILEKYRDPTEVQDFKIPEDKGFFSITKVAQYYGSSVPFGNALVRSTTRLLTPIPIFYNDPVFNMTKDGGLIYNAKNLEESVTLSGNTVGEMLRYFRISIRNGATDYALVCAFEVYRYILTEKVDIVMKLYDEIMKISLELLSPRNLIFHAYISDWMNWVKQGSDIGGLFSNDSEYGTISKQYNPLRLVVIIYMLCIANKSEIVQDVTTLYLNYAVSSEDRNLCEKYVSPINKGVQASMGITVSDTEKKRLDTLQCALRESIRNKNIAAISVGKELAKSEYGKYAMYLVLSEFLNKDIASRMKNYRSDEAYYAMIINTVRGQRDEIYDPTTFENYKNMILSGIENPNGMVYIYLVGNYQLNLSILDENEDGMAHRDTINDDKDISDILAKYQVVKQARLGAS